MGYSTDFQGDFTVTPAMTAAHVAEFEERYNDCGGSDEEGSPGGYCQWQIREGGAAMGWDYEEKFRDYVPWLKHLIAAFFVPRGYVLSGSTKWQGEDMSDAGVIMIKDGKVSTTEDQGPTVKVMIPQKWIDKAKENRDAEAFGKRVLKLAEKSK